VKPHHQVLQYDVLEKLEGHLREALWYARLYETVLETEAIMVAGGFNPVTRKWENKR
jgi:energy-converting hydrogenase Eha subunit F